MFIEDAMACMTRKTLKKKEYGYDAIERQVLQKVSFNTKCKQHLHHLTQLQYVVYWLVEADRIFGFDFTFEVFDEQRQVLVQSKHLFKKFSYKFLSFVDYNYIYQYRVLFSLQHENQQ